MTNDQKGRICVMVLGMHRSGTSAFARVTSLLGCDLPANLMGASEGNAIGHWESNSVVTLNDQLLSAARSSWDDWQALGDLSERLPSAAGFLERAVQILEEEYGSSTMFVLKDPRICRMTSFWFTALERFGARPVIALPIRNPLEVAASLEARDGSQFGHGLLLWLRHVLDAEAASRGLPRCAFGYQDLLSDWRRVVESFTHTTGIEWPCQVTSRSSAIAEFLTDDARHQRLSNEAALSETCPEWVRRTYSALVAWSKEGGETLDYDELDRIKAEFDAAAPTLAKLTMDGMERATGVGEAERERIRLKAEIDRLNQVVARQASSTAFSASPAEDFASIKYFANPPGEREPTRDPHDHVKQLAAGANASVEASGTKAEQHVLDDLERQQPSAMSAGNGNAEAKLDAPWREAEAPSAETNALREHVKALQAQVAELSGALQQREREIVQANADLSVAHRIQEQQTAAGDAQANTLREQIADIRKEVAELADNLRQREREVVQARAEISVERRVQERQTAAMQSELTSWREQVAKLQNQVDELTSALHQRKEEAVQAWADLSVKKRAHDLLKSELDRREADEAVLNRRIAELEEHLQKRTEDLLASEGKALDSQWKAREAAWLADRANDDATRAEAALTQLRASHAEALARVARHEKEAAQLIQFQIELEQRLAAQTQSASAALALAEAAHAAPAQPPHVGNSPSHEEIAQITRIAAEEAGRAHDMQARAEWLRDMNALNQRLPRWWALLPEGMRKQRLQKIAERRGLFDSSAYYSKHPDVAQSGMDALEHYMRHGIFEGRSW